MAGSAAYQKEYWAKPENDRRRKARKKELYLVEKDDRSKKSKTFRNGKKAWIRAIKLERGCAKCGYKVAARALQFHHVDPETKESTVGRISQGSQERLLAEINKCILLCANCHFEIHEGGE